MLGLKYIPRQVSTKDSISLLYPCLSKLLNARVTHFNKASPARKGFNEYTYNQNSRTLRIKYVYQTFQPQGNATLQSSNSSLLQDDKQQGKYNLLVLQNLEKKILEII